MNNKIKRIISFFTATVLLALSVQFSALAINTHKVELVQNSKVNYSGVSKNVFEIKDNGYKSVYAKIVKNLQNDYYVDDVNVSSKFATVKFNEKTGEIYIENVKDDIKISPVIKTKNKATSISADWELDTKGNYDEENPAVGVNFKVQIKDENNRPVANTKGYFKADKNNKSFTKAFTTDKNGNALVKYSFGLNEKETIGEFNPIFYTGSVSVTKSIKLVKQKKSDLYLTVDQVKDALVNTKTGGVINVNSAYEYYTSPLHQGAIVVGAGKWVSPEKGEIKNLSAGQYGIRFKQYIDGNTIYLHSDYDYFTIERATRKVTADIDNSKNVTFDSNKLYATNGGDVYYYVSADENYEISDYSVDKPKYISDISYNKEEGYIKLSGVVGNVKLSVKATPVAVKKTVKKSIKKVASAVENTFEIADIYQAPNSETGTELYVKVNAPEGVLADDISLKFKLSTGKKFSNGKLADGDNFIYKFSISGSVSAEKLYTVYAENNGNETEQVSVKVLKTPNVRKTDFTIKNEQGEKANGTITYTKDDYDQFLYGVNSGNLKLSQGKTITDLSKGTYYIFVPAQDFGLVDGSYSFRVRSSSASVSVGRDEIEEVYYTVKFINADGKIVSETEYAEGTPVNQIAIPKNTATKVADDKIYTYDWEEVKDVTGNAEYKEIETITKKKSTSIEILNVYQNEDTGKRLSFDIKVLDGDGKAVTDSSIVSLYVDGKETRGRVIANNNETFTFVGTTDISTGTHSFYAVVDNSEEYIGSKSASVSVSLSKPEKPILEQTPDTNGRRLGTITVTSSYDKLAFYRQGSASSIEVPENKIITGLIGAADAWTSGVYYVFVVSQSVEGDSDYNFVIQSDKAKIEVQNITIPTYRIEVKDGTLSNGNTVVVADENTVITVTTEKTKIVDEQTLYFSGWYSGEKLFSRAIKYSFYASKDITLTAKYEAVEKVTGPVSIASKTRTSISDTKDKVKLVGEFSVSTDWKIIKAGFVSTSKDSTVISAENFVSGAKGVYTDYGKTNAHNYRYTLTFNSLKQTGWRARTYLVYVDSENKEHIVYGDEITIEPSEQQEGK